MAEGGRERGQEQSNPSTVPARGSVVPTVEAIAGAFANAIRQSFATEQTSGSQLAAPPRLKLVRNQLTRYIHLPFGPPLIVFRVLTSSLSFIGQGRMNEH